MPSANPAVNTQPIITKRAPGRRLALHALGVLIGLALLVPVATLASPSVAARAGSGCSSWNSTTTPPPTIRVLRGRRVVSVRFDLYVARVVSSEWNRVHAELRLAGAVAVKQYAWWKTMHPRHSPAGCFDVHNDTRDQIYHVKTPPGYIWQAVRATWDVTLLRDGQLFMTGYRTGQHRRCGVDATGYKLFARSATRCANNGRSWQEILRIYYGPRLQLQGG